MSQAGTSNITSSNPSIPTSFNGDAGTATPISNILNVVGASGVTTTGSGNTLTITGPGAVTATTFAGNSGTATPASNVLNIVGGSGLSATASGNTVTMGITAPVPVNLGGTGATSLSTTTGITTYDGTKLITSTTAKIDSSGRMTNSAQPVMNAYMTTSQANLTGDGTVATVIFDTPSINVGSMYNSTTGVVTAPVAGNYFISCQLTYNTITAAKTSAQVRLLLSSGLTYINSFAPAKIYDPVTAYASSLLTIIMPLTAGASFSIKAYVAGSTKTTGVQGDNFGYYSSLSCYLIS